MESPAELVPLWNPLSITTLVLAVVGVVGTIVFGVMTAVMTHRRDHPRVEWKVSWAGPSETDTFGFSYVSVWIANRGNGVARDVHVHLGSDGTIFSGDDWDRIEFGQSLRFDYTLVRADTEIQTPGGALRPFRKSVLIKLEWSQEPDLHKRHTRTITKHFRLGQRPITSKMLARTVLNQPQIY